MHTKTAATQPMGRQAWSSHRTCLSGDRLPSPRCSGPSRSSKLQTASASSEDLKVAELLKAADALMSKIGSQELATPQEAVEEPETSKQKIMKLVCDESSCVIVPVATDAKSFGPSGSFIGSSGQAAAEGNRPRDFLLSEGEGWKLGYDRDPINSAAFTALVGSDTWSVSMTKQEFTDFIQLLRKLQRSIATLQTCGEWGGAPQKPPSASGGAPTAPSADSTLELQTDRIWMEARAPQQQLFNLTKLFQRGIQKRPQGQQAAFHLRFIVNAPKNTRQREFEGRFPPEVVMRLLEHLETYPPAIDSLRELGSGSERESAVAGYIG